MIVALLCIATCLAGSEPLETEPVLQLGKPELLAQEWQVDWTSSLAKEDGGMSILSETLHIQQSTQMQNVFFAQRADGSTLRLDVDTNINSISGHVESPSTNDGDEEETEPEITFRVNTITGIGSGLFMKQVCAIELRSLSDSKMMILVRMDAPSPHVVTIVAEGDYIAASGPWWTSFGPSLGMLGVFVALRVFQTWLDTKRDQKAALQAKVDALAAKKKN